MTRWLLLGTLLFCGPAWGQNAVTQNGTVVPGNVMQWAKDRVAQDPGGLKGRTATGLGLNPFSITDNNGLALCANNADTLGPYNALCWGHTSSGDGVISLDSFGGFAQKGLGIAINGITFPFPGAGGGNVVGPSSPFPVAGNPVIWNGGTTVRDGGSSTRNSAVPCGTATDVTTALQNDMDSYSAVGGGKYQMPVGKGCVVGSSADLTIPFNVQVTCSMNGGGAWQGADYAAIADFLLDPAHTIKVVNANQGGRAGVFGCAIVRRGYTKFVTLRDSIDGAANFAGTALVCSGTSDVTFQDNLIIGFGTAISAGCSRINVRRNRMDSMNGFDGVLCFDTCYIDENEVWPFSTAPAGLDFQDTPIANITNVSGAFQVSFSAPPPVAFKQGDRVSIHGVGGTDSPGNYGANGRWTINLLNSTTFLLVGSTFSGTYTPGTGKAFLSAFSRPGTAFAFRQGQFFGQNNLSFGWDNGLVFASGNEGSWCHNCWIDNFQNSGDPVPLGVSSTGTSNNSEYSGYIGQPVRQVYTLGSSPGQFLRMHNTFIPGANGFTNGPAIIGVNTGSLQMTGGFVSGTPANVPFIYVSDSAGVVHLTNVLVASGTILYQTAATGCPKLKIDGVTGPCAFTPVLKGDGAAGTFTYTRQNGQYSQSKAGVDVTLDVGWSAIPSAPTGTNTTLIGLPVTAGGVPGSCALGFTSGLSVPPGGITISLGVPATANFAVLGQASGTGVAGGFAPSLLGTAGAIQATCRYLP